MVLQLSFLLWLWLTRSIIDRQIPTVLSYVDGDEYYGGQAKNFLVRNASNTLAYFKDFLGQEYVQVTNRPIVE